MFVVILTAALFAGSARTPGTPIPAPGCARLTRGVAAGSVIMATDLAPAECPDRRPSAGLVYDSTSQLAKAGRDLSVGELVRCPPGSTLAAFASGERVRLVSTFGPVTVEREVEVMQAARIGAKVWVKGAGGQAFPVEPGEVHR